MKTGEKVVWRDKSYTIEDLHYYGTYITAIISNGYEMYEVPTMDLRKDD